MGRRARRAWVWAFAVSGALWLVTQTWDDGPPAPAKPPGKYYVCAEVSTDPVCAGFRGRSSAGGSSGSYLGPASCAQEGVCAEIYPSTPYPDDYVVTDPLVNPYPGPGGP